MENNKKHKILLIDDEPRILSIIQNVLQRFGYDVTCSADGKEAVEIFKENPTDLVITDIRMPGMDGMEVVKHVKAIDPLTQVIVLTGYGTIDLAIQSLRDCDAFDFLTKPKGASELESTVKKALEHGDLLRKNERLQNEIREHNLNLTRQNEELRQFQTALERSHRRYQDLYHNAPVGYLTLDKDGNIIDTNQTAAVMFGAQRTAMIQQAFRTLIEPSDRDEYDTCRQSLQNEDAHVCEMTLRKTDSSTFSARIEAKGVTDTEENQRQTRVIVTDITAQKEIQQRMIETRKIDAITALAGGVAHQFNNALAGLTGYLELIQIECNQKETKNAYIQSAMQQIQRMASLTQQLLAYASGGKYAPDDIQLNQFIEDILSLIHHTISKNNRLETDLQADTQMIRADNTQLQMVLLALVQNASEAMTSPGRITISTRNATFLPKDIDRNSKRRTGNFICLCVADEGCGMDKTTVEKIFDPFFTTKFIGRGLGLSAVYGIISNHHGWIEVDSTLEKGTKVSVYLPAIAPKAMAPTIRKEVDTDGHDATVLVIEDDVPLRKVTRQLLGRLNYKILEAETGEEARAIINGHSGPIDAVILDMLLPDTDGESLYYELRKIRSDLKIILCSGYAMDKPVKDLLKAGALGFLPKPYSTKTLATELKKIIGTPAASD